MGIFDNDPKFQELRRIREEEGYDGPLDQDNRKVNPMSREAEILDALRRTGAGA